MRAKIDEISQAIRNECQAHGYLVSIPENASLWVHLSRAAASAARRKPTMEMTSAAECYWCLASHGR